MPHELHQTSRVRPTKDGRDIVRLSQQVEALSQELDSTRRPQLAGRYLEEDPDGDAITLTAASITLVAHGLGRAYRGWCLGSLNANSVVWNSSDADIDSNNIDKTLFLPLECSANVTVKLVVW